MIQKAQVKRIMKGVAIENNIGKDAVDVVCQAAESYIVELTKRAATAAAHAGHKTIKASDVQLVLSFN